jgi:hypothetical protein
MAKISLLWASLLFLLIYVSTLLIVVERYFLFRKGDDNNVHQRSDLDRMVAAGSTTAAIPDLHSSVIRREGKSLASSSYFKNSKSLSLLMNQVLQVERSVPDTYHNSASDEQLCQKFEFLSYNNRTKRRRIFAGGLIADDSWHVIGASALETYGIFHSVTFIESNRTQNFTPRKIRFESSNNPTTHPSQDYKILQSGIYGPNTPVYVEYFIHETKEFPLKRESLMRERILEKWKELGMTKEDIGIILDVDEIPSREFLRAAQICDPPDNNWRTDDKQTCRAPLVRMSIPMFEGSPKCLHKNIKNQDFINEAGGNEGMITRFVSSAMVIGACIDGIGDIDKYPIIPREHKDINGKPLGSRLTGYGEKFDYSKIPNGNENGLFGLYNAADFRRMQSSASIFGGVGYHLHNFFDSADNIRFKYAYYGHVHKHAYTAPLGAMNADMNVLVKCAHNISDEGNRKQRFKNGLQFLEHSHSPLPIAFHIKGYVDARHRELIDLVENDEVEYGRADLFDGHHLYHEGMITHPGRLQREEKK